jgi:LmbE family N-acetylglucosaminyl deacetylase
MPLGWRISPPKSAFFLIVLLIAFPMVLFAQDLGVGAILERRAGMGVQARVLMIAAHPDDEDTQLITWLARGHRAKTAYLALTRGDGGQNLIGNELGEALGVIRTEELLAARRIDGAQQFFTRAYDFGFSKTAEETFKHWPRDSILGDVIKVVRAFRPHIIVSVFSGTPRDGHGHHQVAGLLAKEAYELAGDTVRFPRAKYGAPWTPLKFYRSARFARQLATLSMDVGEYDTILGRSYAEIAALSRSQHKSQGFGTAQRKGSILDYVTREATRVNASTPPTEERSIFEGIDTARVATEGDSNALALAEAHIAVEAIAERERVALGDSVPVRVSIYRRGILDTAAVRTVYVRGERITEPYWLAKPRIGDLFPVASDSIPDDEREKESWISVPVTVLGRSKPVVVRVPPIYRYTDPVRGDVQRPLVTAPAISVTFTNGVNGGQVARADAEFQRPFEVTVRSSVAQPCTVTVGIELPKGLQADVVTRSISLAPGATRTVTFFVSGRLPKGDHVVKAYAEMGGTRYTTGFIPIEYDHITPQRMYRAASLLIRSVDVNLPENAQIGYVQGVGDNVAPVLQQLGLSVTMLDPSKFPVTDLSQYTTIVVGPRAYQSSQTLVENNTYLLEYVRRGGNLVVQYGQYEMQAPGMMPYPITLGRPAARVTEEDAPVEILDSKSPILNIPNRITAADFDGWVQERSLYMPSTFDENYQTVMSMNDPGEAANRAGILTVRYGSGQYTYVTLSLFRQLPAAVPGGIRLFANLLTPSAHP